MCHSSHTSRGLESTSGYEVPGLVCGAGPDKVRVAWEPVNVWGAGVAGHLRFHQCPRSTPPSLLGGGAGGEEVSSRDTTPRGP